jgi:hypothetical protein
VTPIISPLLTTHYTTSLQQHAFKTTLNIQYLSWRYNRVLDYPCVSIIRAPTLLTSAPDNAEYTVCKIKTGHVNRKVVNERTGPTHTVGCGQNKNTACPVQDSTSWSNNTLTFPGKFSRQKHTYWCAGLWSRSPSRGVGRNFRWSRYIFTDSDSDLNLKSYLDTPTPEPWHLQ